MLLEALALLTVLLVAWYVQFRPRSPLNLRPGYTVLTEAPAPAQYSASALPVFDYVVVGGGPAGLAAARTLLERTEPTGASVLLVERGTDLLPTSSWRAILQSVDRSRLLSFAPDMVYLPTVGGLLPGKLGPTLAGECVEDGCVAHRPFRFLDADDDDDKDDKEHKEHKDDKEHKQTEEGEKRDAAAAATVAGNKKAEGGSTGTSGPLAVKSVKTRIIETLFCYTAYPQGRGIGGTAQLDWGLHLPSIFSAKAPTTSSDKGEEKENTTHQAWWKLPVAFTKVRNPLSWAFAEASAETLVKRRYMPTETSPCEAHAVYPVLLRVDEDGRRLPLASAILRDVAPRQLHRLSVLLHHTVASLNTNLDDADVADEWGTVAGGKLEETCVVESVTCVSKNKDGKSLRCTIEVTTGVVLAAGVVHSPRLLRRIATPSARNNAVSSPFGVGGGRALMRDVLALPMVFRAQPHLSADAKNAQELRSSALWYLTQRGPMLQPVVDTVASVPVPELGPQAEMRFLMMPFGGRDPRRFYQLGWDRVLANFEEAVTILMVVSGVEGLAHPVDLAEAGGTGVGTRSLLTQRHLHPLAVVEEDAAARKEEDEEEEEGAEAGDQPLTLPPVLQEKVVRAFVKAMRDCRRVTGTAPLSLLVPPRGGNVNSNAGEEAIDFALLRESPTQAVQLAKLVHTVPAKRSATNKRDLASLLAWAYRIIETEAYMQRYVAQHAYWLGFGSGTSETFLDAEKPFTVKGMSNVVVGDNSAVTEAQWVKGGRDSLAAGSVSSAVAAGKLAAEALV